MKKILLVLGLVTLTTNVSFSAIDQNLKYGQKSPQVTELQEFLIDKGLLTGNATGYFGLLTLKGVKAYQTSQKLPSTGFVGPMTREKINAEISAEIASSSEAEMAETGTTTPVVSTTSMTDFCPNIEGVQTGVPSGMVLNSTNGCYTAPTAVLNTGNVPNEVSVPVVVSAPAPEPFKKLLVKMTNGGKLYVQSSKDIDFTSFKFVRPVCVPLPRSGCTDWTTTQEIPVTIVMESKEIHPADVAQTRYYLANITANFADYLTDEEKEINKSSDIGYHMRATVSSTDGVTKTFESGAGVRKDGSVWFVDFGLQN